MIEVTFRKLVVKALPREIDGLRVWPQNTGTIVIPGTKTDPRRAFHSGVPLGASDVSGILSPEGVRVEIELKSPTAKLTEEQRLWGLAIQRLGGIYVLFRMTTTDGPSELPRCVEAVRAAVASWRARRA